VAQSEVAAGGPGLLVAQVEVQKQEQNLQQEKIKAALEALGCTADEGEDHEQDQ